MPQQPIDRGNRQEAVRKIADLNDRLRKSISNPGRDRVVMTMGIANLVGDVSLFRNFRKRAQLVRLIRDFETAEEATSFSARERDMGWFEFEGRRCMWKIDYYDNALILGSEDPTDPEQTIRVLTIMLVTEY